jgi:uncharacterized protein YdcH (DUF465 family)
MTLEHHDLIHELPEHRERIHQLLTSNNHFSRLFDEYHRVTKEVERLEGLGTPVDDASIEAMKSARLKLKDELYAIIRQA